MSNFIKVTPKLWKAEHSPNYIDWGFHCPGCSHLHSFSTGSGAPINWSFNGDVNSPTFSPSLLVNKDHPNSRCHLFLTDGKIHYQADCYHDLKNQVVDMVDI